MEDGKVHVFDLHWNVYKPLCVQSVIARKMGKLNHIAFNPSHPIIIVGDSCGQVQMSRTNYQMFNVHIM